MTQKDYCRKTEPKRLAFYCWEKGLKELSAAVMNLIQVPLGPVRDINDVKGWSGLARIPVSPDSLDRLKALLTQHLVSSFSEKPGACATALFHTQDVSLQTPKYRQITLAWITGLFDMFGHPQFPSDATFTFRHDRTFSSSWTITVAEPSSDVPYFTTIEPGARFPIRV